MFIKRALGILPEEFLQNDGKEKKNLYSGEFRIESVRKEAASFCFVFYFDKVSQNSDLCISPFDVSIWVFFRYDQLIVFETGLLTATSPSSWGSTVSCHLIADRAAQAQDLELSLTSFLYILHPGSTCWQILRLLTAPITPADNHTAPHHHPFSSVLPEWPPNGVSIIHPCSPVYHTTIWVIVPAFKYKSDHVILLLKTLATLFPSEWKLEVSYQFSCPREPDILSLWLHLPLPSPPSLHAGPVGL